MNTVFPVSHEKITLPKSRWEWAVTSLLYAGAIFYIFEFFLHFFGLPILEHDKIFMYTHDRYIALFALTYGILLLLINSNKEKYKMLFSLTMIGIFLSFLNGLYISLKGGYALLFPVFTLDNKLSTLGYVFVAWYVFLLWCWYKMRKMEKAE